MLVVSFAYSSSSVFYFRIVNTIKEYDKNKEIKHGTRKGKRQQSERRYDMQVGEEELAECNSGQLDMVATPRSGAGISKKIKE